MKNAVEVWGSTSAGHRRPRVPSAPDTGQKAELKRFGRAPSAAQVSAVRLLDVDRDLARHMEPSLAEARDAAVAAAVALPRGRWNPVGATARVRSGFGLLVLRGLLIRNLHGRETLAGELLSAGDLIGAEDGSEERVVGLEPRWEVLEAAAVLLLDGAFAQRVAPFPTLTAALMERAHDRARRAAIVLALSHLPRVEDRLHRLLWHLADRRGHVSAEGIVLTLPITQEQLGRLVGARRPTVSLALRSLRERGLVHRTAKHHWILANQSPTPGD